MNKSDDLIWGNLLHLSFNMWPDRNAPNLPHEWKFHERMYFDDALWLEITQEMAAVGMNMVVLDLGDAVYYASHPEISLPDAWSHDRLKRELARLRNLGLEPIPKLNFSTGHDAWMKEYSRMVSTPKYYEVCANLIAEISALFNTPRFFHLGMDEETATNQTHFNLAVIRQHELYWHDFQFLVDEVEKHGVRAWIWSDMIWDHAEAWLKHMPKQVLQSNWYYHNEFENAPAKYGRDMYAPNAYALLEQHGFDQIPCASVWATPENLALTVAHCQHVIAPERLKGFLMASWEPTVQTSREKHLLALRCVAEAKAGFNPPFMPKAE